MLGVTQRILSLFALWTECLLCRPFWLPRELKAVVATAVYIPPQVEISQITDLALKELLYSQGNGEHTSRGCF